MQQGDTISAIATAMGEGGIGIIRVSGERAMAVATAVFQPASGRRLLSSSPYSTTSAATSHAQRPCW